MDGWRKFLSESAAARDSKQLALEQGIDYLQSKACNQELRLAQEIDDKQNRLSEFLRLETSCRMLTKAIGIEIREKSSQRISFQDPKRSCNLPDITLDWDDYISQSNYVSMLRECLNRYNSDRSVLSELRAENDLLRSSTVFQPNLPRCFNNESHLSQENNSAYFKYHSHIHSGFGQNSVLCQYLLDKQIQASRKLQIFLKEVAGHPPVPESDFEQNLPERIQSSNHDLKQRLRLEVRQLRNIFKTAVLWHLSRVVQLFSFRIDVFRTIQTQIGFNSNFLGVCEGHTSMFENQMIRSAIFEILIKRQDGEMKYGLLSEIIQSSKEESLEVGWVLTTDNSLVTHFSRQQRAAPCPNADSKLLSQLIEVSYTPVEHGFRRLRFEAQQKLFRLMDKFQQTLFVLLKIVKIQQNKKLLKFPVNCYMKFHLNSSSKDRYDAIKGEIRLLHEVEMRKLRTELKLKDNCFQATVSLQNKQYLAAKCNLAERKSFLLQVCELLSISTSGEISKKRSRIDMTAYASRKNFAKMRIREK